MKTEWRRFAPIGLYISLVAALVSICLYIIFRKFDLGLQISLGMILIGLALYALLDPDRVRRFLSGRQVRYGSNALVLSLAFVGIIVVVNYLVYNHSKTWDLTEGKQHTLAPETIDALSKLQQPVKALAFFTKSANSSNAQSLLELYKSNSKGKFDYEFIDPNANPAAAEKAKIVQDGTVVLTMGDNQQPVTLITEQELTGALVRLMNPEKRAVYFLTGHGERSLDATGQDSIALLKRTLESKNYTVAPLNLLAANKIPDDAKVIVIAGPKNPVSQTEVDQLKAFAEKGGALVVMEEPSVVTQFGDAPDPLADYLAKSWDILLGNNIVVDPTSQQPFIPYAASYGNSPITEKIKTITSAFPTVRSVTVLTNTIESVSPLELVFTANQAWGETDFSKLSDTNAKIEFDPKTDLAGPVPLAAAAENFTTKGRVVVFGDSDFILDPNYVYYANGDLMVNSIDWAAGQEAMISLTPKENKQRTLLPPETARMNLILLGTVILVPGLALLGAILVFIQRRRRM